MNRSRIFLIAAAMLLTGISYTQSIEQLIQSARISPQEINKLSSKEAVAAANEKPRTRIEGGILRFIGAPQASYFPLFREVSGSPEQIAREFLTEQAVPFGITNPRISFTLEKITTDAQGRNFVRFQQTFDGLPVYGAEVILQVGTNGGIQCCLSTLAILDKTSLDTEPGLSASEAEGILKTTLKEENILKPTFSKPILTFYDPDVWGYKGYKSLVWQTTVTSELDPAFADRILINAASGKIEFKCSLTEYSKNRNIFDANETATIPTTATRSEGGAASSILDVNNAYVYLGDTYDFYLSHFGWKSYNNIMGTAINAITRYCGVGNSCPYYNAYWSYANSEMYFGLGMTSDEALVAHEFTHGVTATLSGLGTSGEPGAINESMSDIFGIFVDQQYNLNGSTTAAKWSIGEDTPAGAFRNMSHPTYYGHPDRYDSYFYSFPNDEIHKNAGVGNHLAYLLTEGGVFNGYVINPVLPYPANDRIIDLYWYVQNHLTPSAFNYFNLHSALTAAANSLNWTASETQNLENACLAVEISSITNNSPKIVYVSTAGNDLNDGLSWASPKLTIMAADIAALPGDQIWVKKGSYNGDISLKARVSLYGGFAGNETQTTQRTDIHGANLSTIYGSGATSVVTIGGSETGVSYLDGFTITHGGGLFNGSGVNIGNAGITVNNNYITSCNCGTNSGGGVFISGRSTAKVLNNIISNCSSIKGGGIYIVQESTPTIINNIIYGNTAQFGGGIYDESLSQLKIINNTIITNISTDSTQLSGGFRLENGTVTFANNILAFNSSGISTYSLTGDVFESNDVYGNNNHDWSGASSVPVGSNEIAQDPMFANSSSNDYHPRYGSPIINAGLSSVISSLVSTDIDGTNRMIGSAVDIGPYEYAAYLSTISVNPSYIRGGETAFGTVTLAAPAPGGGVTISLSTNVPSAAQPAVTSINFAKGEITKTFNINTFIVSADTPVTLSANSLYGTVSTSFTVHFDNAPSAINDNYFTKQNVALNIASPGVLANDIDSEGDPISAILVSNVSHGVLTFNSNGSFNYVPNQCYSGTDSFTYKAFDGVKYSIVATVNILVMGTVASIATQVTTQWPKKVLPSSGADQAQRMVLDNSGNIIVTGYSGNGSNGNNSFRTIKYAPEGTVIWDKTYPAQLNNNTGATGLAVDAQGNVYISGYAFGTNSQYDLTVVKYNAAGTSQTSVSYIPSNSSKSKHNDETTDLALDSQGNVYVTGNVYSNSGDLDYLTIKYNSDLIQQWAVPYNGSANSTDLGKSIAVNNVGDAYVTGHSMGKDSMGNSTGDDCVTNKYRSSDGTLLWSKRYNGTVNGDDYGVAVKLDANGNVYVLGTTYTGIDTSTTPNIDRHSDFLVIKYDPSGNQQWYKTYDGPDHLSETAYYPQMLAVNSQGDAYITGYTETINSYHAFVIVKYNTNGAYQWDKRYQAPANTNEYPQALCLDNQNNVYVTGSADNGTNSDFLTIKYDSNSNMIWNKRYDSGSYDSANAIAVDTQGNVYTAGSSTISGQNTITTVKYTQTVAAPLAATDSYNVNEYSTLTVNAANSVLSNDSDPVGNGLNAVLVSGPNNAVPNSFYLYSDGSFVYTPASGYYGTDSFTYKASNCSADSAPTTVSISVKKMDPTAVDDSYKVQVNRTLSIDAPGVLSNDISPTFQPLSAIIVTPPTHGTLSLHSDGSFIYTTLLDCYVGTDSFTYKVFDGQHFSTPATVTIQILEPTTSIVNPPSWIARYNGPANDYDRPVKVVVDSLGNSYVTGWSRRSGGSDYREILTAKYNSSGGEVWTKRWHSNTDQDDEPFDLTLDGSGNICVTGQTLNTGTTNYDFITLKYDNSGGFLWAAAYDGPGNDMDSGNAIAVDANGNVYVCGQSTGNGTNFDIALVKYDSSGAFKWVYRYDGPAHGSDQPEAMALDTVGNVYITGKSYRGSTTDDDFITLKIDPSGTSAIKVWESTFDGIAHSTDAANGIKIDNQGNVFVTGKSYGGAGRAYDFATIKYRGTDGNQLWATLYNSITQWDDIPAGLAIDNLGNVFVTGYTNDVANGDNSSYTTVKYDSAGNEKWVKKYNAGNGQQNAATAITSDIQGNIYVTGYSWGNANSNDYATVKYDTNGNQLWVQRYDSTYHDHDKATSIAVNNLGEVFVTGESRESSNNWDYATIKYTQSVAAPTANPETYAGFQNTPMVVDVLNGVLRNDTDPAGNGLKAVLVNGPNHAALNSFQLKDDGSFTYTPVTGFHSSDQFSYIAYNCVGESNIATVTINIGSGGTATFTGKVKLIGWSGGSLHLPNIRINTNLGSTPPGPVVYDSTDGTYVFSIPQSGVNYVKVKPAGYIAQTITLTYAGFSSGYSFAGPGNSGLIQIGDVNGDGIVDDTDLLAVINNFLQTSISGVTLDADMNGDGIVDDSDLLIVINNFLSTG